MCNNTENYRTAVANDKSHAINGTIATIAYKLTADPASEMIKLISKRKNSINNINTVNKTETEPSKTFANQNVKQCKKCGQNYK